MARILQLVKSCVELEVVESVCTKHFQRGRFARSTQWMENRVLDVKGMKEAYGIVETDEM